MKLLLVLAAFVLGCTLVAKLIVACVSNVAATAALS